MAAHRKPTALKILQGTAQPCRTNFKEPKVSPGVPDAPDHLSAAARKYWPEIVAMVDHLGVLATSDKLAVESLTETYASLIECRQKLEARGAMTYERGGVWRVYPEVRMVDNLDKAMLAWLARLGLTPADRSRVSTLTTPADGDAGWEQFGA